MKYCKTILCMCVCVICILFIIRQYCNCCRTPTHKWRDRYVDLFRDGEYETIESRLDSATFAERLGCVMALPEVQYSDDVNHIMTMLARDNADGIRICLSGRLENIPPDMAQYIAMILINDAHDDVRDNARFYLTSHSEKTGEVPETPSGIPGSGDSDSEGMNRYWHSGQ